MARPYRDDLTQWRICRSCLELYEVRRSREQPQLCRCRTQADEPTWDLFDFNERAHLCECCLGVVLESGSKFSVWFCAECKERIMGFNARFGRTVIPFGRHSLMANVSLGGPGRVEWAEGEDPAGDTQVEAFRIQLRGLVDSMDHLHDWSHESSPTSWGNSRRTAPMCRSPATCGPSATQGERKRDSPRLGRSRSSALTSLRDRGPDLSVTPDEAWHELSRGSSGT